MRVMTSRILLAALGLAVAGCGGAGDVKAKIDPLSMPSSATLYVPGMT
jgi:hypothetical protein